MIKTTEPDYGFVELLRAGDAEALLRLSLDPTDASGLMVIYERHRLDLEDSAIRWLRRDPKVYPRAIINILIGIARRAPEFDPLRMEASDWIRNSANDEARRLRQLIQSGCRDKYGGEQAGVP